MRRGESRPGEDEGEKGKEGGIELGALVCCTYVYGEEWIVDGWMGYC